MSRMQRFFLCMAVFHVVAGSLHLSEGNYGGAMFSAGTAAVMLALMLTLTAKETKP